MVTEGASAPIGKGLRSVHVILTILRLELTRAARRLHVNVGGHSTFLAISSRRVALVAAGVPAVAAVLAGSGAFTVLSQQIVSESAFATGRSLLAAVLAVVLAPTLRMILESTRRASTVGLLYRAEIRPLQIISGLHLIPSLWRFAVAWAGMLGAAGGAALAGAPFPLTAVLTDFLVSVAIWVVVTGLSLAFAVRAYQRGSDTRLFGWILALMTGAAFGASVGPAVSGFAQVGAGLDLRSGQVLVIAVILLALGVSAGGPALLSWQRASLVPQDLDPDESGKGGRTPRHNLTVAEWHHFTARLSGRTPSVRNVSVLLTFLGATAISLRLAGQVITLPHPAAFGLLVPLGALVTYAAIADALEPESDPGPVRLLRRIPGAVGTQLRVRLWIALGVTGVGALIAAGLCSLAFTDRLPVPTVIAAVATFWLFGIFLVLLVGFERVRRDSLPWPEDLPLTGLLALPGLVLAFGAGLLVDLVPVGGALSVMIFLLAATSPLWPLTLVHNRMGRSPTWVA